MIDILALLKRIELAVDCGDGCPGCGHYSKGEHQDDCQLKAAIDALESGELVVIDKLIINEIAKDLYMSVEALQEWIIRKTHD